jgi:hypothetical protein
MMLVPGTAPTAPTPIDIEVTEEEILADLLFPAPVPPLEGGGAEEHLR